MVLALTFNFVCLFSDDEKKKMIDILQRVNELEEEEQEDEQEVHQEFEQEAEELEIRLSNIDISKYMFYQLRRNFSSEDNMTSIIEHVTL